MEKTPTILQDPQLKTATMEIMSEVEAPGRSASF